MEWWGPSSRTSPAVQSWPLPLFSRTCGLHLAQSAAQVAPLCAVVRRVRTNAEGGRQEGVGLSQEATVKSLHVLRCSEEHVLTHRKGLRFFFGTHNSGSQGPLFRARRSCPQRGSASGHWCPCVSQIRPAGSGPPQPRPQGGPRSPRRPRPSQRAQVRAVVAWRAALRKLKL